MRNIKKLQFVVISLAMIFTSAFSVYAFTDTNGSPYEEAIDDLAELELVLGTGNNVYGVADNVTRQQMALFIARLASGLTVTDSPNSINTTIFTDLVDSVYNHAISYCYENDIIIGKGGTIFDPTGDVLVQEAITMAVRALGYNDLDYPDGYIEKAEEAGLLANLNGLDYEAPMLRGEVAQLVYNSLYSSDNVNGKAFYDIYFAPVAKLGYFEITTPEELMQNYNASKYVGGSGATSYYIYDVTLFGYTGDLCYRFNDGTNDEIYLGGSNNPTKCTILFDFSIKGQKVNVEGTFKCYAADSAAELSAEEAKVLIESVNQKAADCVDFPVADAQVRIKKDGGPSDIYEAAVNNFVELDYIYNNINGYCSLRIYTKPLVGCLRGTLEYTVK